MYSISYHSCWLGVDDLRNVLNAVEPLSARWRLLSSKLGLPESALDVIECDHPGDAKTCLYKALGEWLRQNYDHQRHGRPSWRRLAEAVCTLDYGLFEKIAKAHMHNSIMQACRIIIIGAKPPLNKLSLPDTVHSRVAFSHDNRFQAGFTPHYVTYVAISVSKTLIGL